MIFADGSFVASGVGALERLLVPTNGAVFDPGKVAGGAGAKGALDSGAGACRRLESAVPAPR